MWDFTNKIILSVEFYVILLLKSLSWARPFQGLQTHKPSLFVGKLDTSSREL